MDNTYILNNVILGFYKQIGNQILYLKRGKRQASKIGFKGSCNSLHPQPSNKILIEPHIDFCLSLLLGLSDCTVSL